MTHNTIKCEMDERMTAPFGWIPELYLPFLKGEPDLADMGPILFGPDFGAKLLINVEAAQLMTEHADRSRCDDVLRTLRCGVTRVLGALSDEPPRRLMLVIEARSWFGRPVLAHQVLDIGEPFIAIAA